MSVNIQRADDPNVGGASNHMERRITEQDDTKTAEPPRVGVRVEN
jgi:hypothetical protein